MTWTPLSRSKGQRSTLQGRGKLWRPPARLVNFTYFLQCLDSAVWMTEMSACCYLNIIIYHFLISLGLRGVFCTSAALSFAVIKVVLWSRGAHLTKPGWSKPHTHSNPTNLALFRCKISLYRFNQGGSYYCRGAQVGAGAEPLGPPSLYPLVVCHVRPALGWVTSLWWVWNKLTDSMHLSGDFRYFKQKYICFVTDLDRSS